MQIVLVLFEMQVPVIQSTFHVICVQITFGETIFVFCTTAQYLRNRKPCCHCQMYNKEWLFPQIPSILNTTMTTEGWTFFSLGTICYKRTVCSCSCVWIFSSFGWSVFVCFVVVAAAVVVLHNIVVGVVQVSFSSRSLLFVIIYSVLSCSWSLLRRRHCLSLFLLFHPVVDWAQSTN